jgi:hypothetical protein
VTDRYIPQEVRDRVRAEAGNRCGYRQSPQHLVLGQREIEHIIPTAAGRSDDEENLWLACRLCNSFKGIQTEGRDSETGQTVRLFGPRRQRWNLAGSERTAAHDRVMAERSSFISGRGEALDGRMTLTTPSKASPQRLC